MKILLLTMAVFVLAFSLLAPLASATGTYDNNATADGSPERPYEIADATQLLSLSQHSEDWDKCFILTDDIDMDPFLPGGQVFERAPIATHTKDYSEGTTGIFVGIPFSGNFDGAGHVISHLTINTNGLRKDYIGLFGKITSTGQLKNLVLSDVAINVGDWSYAIGSLCGQNYGEIIDCQVNGDICGGTRSRNMGGLCGISDGIIRECSSTIDLLGDRMLGGLCGYNYALIIACQVSGSVTGINASNTVGGLVGENRGNIGDSFTEGIISGGTNCSWFGGLCGRMDFEGASITNSYASGIIIIGNNCSDIGGFCGYNVSGDMTNCWSNVQVEANDTSEYLGGFCGRNLENGNIKDCYALGNVTAGYGANYMGGLCGSNYCTNTEAIASISRCYSLGAVSAGEQSNSIGGFCGFNRYGIIDQCGTESEVVCGTGSTAVGGFCGEHYYFAELSNSYSIGNVNGGASTIVAGFCGLNNGSIYNCWTKGKVTIDLGATKVGGFCGQNRLGTNWITSCYWDLQTSEQTMSDGGIGLTTEEMKQQASFTAWDFHNIWTICEVTNYPRLQWQKKAEDFLCPDGVDLLDFSVIATAWLTNSDSDNWNPLCDLVDDGIIDILDLVTFIQQWLSQQ